MSLDRIPLFLDAAAKGDCLGVADLSEFEKALSAIKRLKNYLENDKKYEIALAFYEENLDPLEEIHEAIYGTIVNEKVADQATRLLKSLRSDIARSEEKMREKRMLSSGQTRNVCRTASARFVTAISASR